MSWVGGFVGAVGVGLAMPVVSYAPRPMINDNDFFVDGGKFFIGGMMS